MAADVAGRVSGKRIKEEEKEEKEGGGEGWDLESKESEEAERLLHINSFMMVPNHLRKFFSFFYIKKCNLEKEGSRWRRTDGCREGDRCGE